MRKRKTVSRKRGGNVGILVDGSQPSPLKNAALGALSRALDRAVELGREEAAKKIAEEIGKAGGVQGTTISQCNFTQG